MPNFIQETLAAAAAKRAAAEAERQKALATPPPSTKSNSSHEKAMQVDALFREGEKVFQQTGIQQTLQALNGWPEVKVQGVRGDRDRPSVVLDVSEGEGKPGHSVQVTYNQNGTVEIKGAETQILTPADLQNNDTVAAALEKAVKHPKKGLVWNGTPPSSSDGGPNNVVGGKY